MISRIVSIYRNAYTGLPRPAWVLFFVQLVNTSGSMVLFYLALYLTRELGFSLSQAGRTLSMYGAGQLAGAYVGGWLSDRIGAARIQALSLAGCGIFFISLSFLHTYVPIVVMVFILALFAGALFPAANTSMTRVCTPDMQPRGFALNRLASNLGWTIGPVVGGFLALYNYRLLFWVDGLTSLAAAVIFHHKFREPRARPHPQHKNGGRAVSPWRDLPFLYFLLLVFFMGLIFFQFFSTFSVYLRNIYRLLENRIGWLLTVNTLMIIAIEMPLIDTLKKFSPVRAIALGCIFLGAGFALMPLGRGFLYAAFTVAVWTIGEMLTQPLMTSIVAARCGPGNLGSYMGAYSFAFSIAFIIGPSLGTWVYGAAGPSALWFCCGLLGLLVFFGFQLFLHLQHGPAREV